MAFSKNSTTNLEQNYIKMHYTAGDITSDWLSVSNYSKFITKANTQHLLICEAL